YVEGFAQYSDNFLPFPTQSLPAGVRYDRTTTLGLHYRLNYLTPYWDPEGGFQFDASYSAGGVDFIDWEGYHALQSEFRTVRRLPDGLGRFSDTTVAGHVGGAIAFPDKGQYFALGGSQTFRGFDLSERQGSLLWYAGVEARLPLLRDLNADVCDHIAGLRNVYLATFYDVGAVYADGEIVGGNVAHALGVGLRFDVTWFSLIERTMLRFDAAKTLNAASPWQFWFGVQHPF
ncbi:MAG TPA: hypothetical protein VIL46_18965, partial [Gemmataceae bacterium]